MVLFLNVLLLITNIKMKAVKFKRLPFLKTKDLKTGNMSAHGKHDIKK